MQAYCYAYYYSMPSSFDLGSAVPCIDLAVQSLGETYLGEDGKYYQEDLAGDRCGEVFEGIYVSGVTGLAFDDLTGLNIAEYYGNGTVVINGNSVTITGTEFSSIVFDDGSYYSIEFINDDGLSIFGEQDCIISGTAGEIEINNNYKSFMNLYGYNEISGDYGSDYGSDYA